MSFLFFQPLRSDLFFSRRCFISEYTNGTTIRIRWATALHAIRFSECRKSNISATTSSWFQSSKLVLWLLKVTKVKVELFDDNVVSYLRTEICVSFDSISTIAGSFQECPPFLLTTNLMFLFLKYCVRTFYEVGNDYIDIFWICIFHLHFLICTYRFRNIKKNFFFRCV